MAADSDDALTIRNVTERLVTALPGVNSHRVHRSVQIAYNEFRYARVRSYLPVLMERRAKDLLTAESPHPSLDGTAGRLSP
ncbi:MULTISPECIES: three-helix bundle dimerization domain-containing protein [unclassified Streptomyces]|uniref:three-helix bundle dimerization domain-containing protein n=1 Tax=unclassified Streptomyces TaxID=2593676 RepID=UPI003649A582